MIVFMRLTFVIWSVSVLFLAPTQYFRVNVMPLFGMEWFEVALGL